MNASFLLKKMALIDWWLVLLNEKLKKSPLIKTN
jgi:hypothetical protein